MAESANRFGMSVLLAALFVPSSCTSSTTQTAPPTSTSSTSTTEATDADRAACLALSRPIGQPTDRAALSLPDLVRTLERAPEAALRQAATSYRSAKQRHDPTAFVGLDRLKAQCERAGWWHGSFERFVVVHTTYGHMLRIAPNLAGSALIPGTDPVLVVQTTYQPPIRVPAEGPPGIEGTVRVPSAATITDLRTKQATDSCQGCRPFHRDGWPHRR